MRDLPTQAIHTAMIIQPETPSPGARAVYSTLATFLIGVAAAWLMSAASASAEGDTLAEFYGNTLISKDGDFETHWYYQRDHTFTATLPAYYLVLKGTWTETPTGEICRVFSVPLPHVKNPDCNMMRVHKVGDAEKEANGDSEKLVTGVQ